MLVEKRASRSIFVGKNVFYLLFSSVSITVELIQLQRFHVLNNSKKINLHISQNRFVNAVALSYLKLTTILTYCNASPLLLQRIACQRLVDGHSLTI